MPETVMIVAGETSGELYGSLLAEALRKKIPDLNIIGIGGQRMRASGVKLIAGIAGAIGLAEVFSALRELKKTFRSAVNVLSSEKPAVLVLIDYPDFNLRLAAEARKLEIKVLFYVSPQVWAWRRKRIYKIARLVDRMAVILPFEPEVYRETGLECEFVGHPVLDEIAGMGAGDRELMKQELGLNAAAPLLSLLPGSRTNEIDRLLPLLADLIPIFRSEFGSFQFCIPFAPNTDLAKYASIIEPLKAQGVVINQGRSLQVLAASDLAVAASGTVTLQSVLLKVPVVVIYKLSPLTYIIGKMLISGKFFSLANILSGREVVRELLQKQVTLENIIAELRRILRDDHYRKGMLDAYEDVYSQFSGRHASERVADMVIEMASWRSQDS